MNDLSEKQSEPITVFHHHEVEHFEGLVEELFLLDVLAFDLGHLYALLEQLFRPVYHGFVVAPLLLAVALGVLSERFHPPTNHPNIITLSEYAKLCHYRRDFRPINSRHMYFSCKRMFNQWLECRLTD